MTTLKRFLTLLLVSTLTLSVWGDDTWNKVTSEPADWSGEYLLIYESSATAGVAWTGVDANNGNVAVTISSGIISTKPASAVSITIASMTGGYSIKVNGGTNDGKYINGTSGSNALGFSNSAQLNTLSYESSSVAITSNTSVMRYNSASGNCRFRYFKSTTYSSQQVVQLYKKTPSGGSSYTITAVSNNDSWGTVSGTTTITASPAVGYQVKESEPYTVTSGSATVTRGTGADSNKFTVSASSDCTVRINFEPIPTHAIRFFNNGTQIGATQNIAEGSSPVVPSDPAACDEGYAFVGWWTAELAEDNTTAYTWVTDFTVSGAQDYYAVFSVAGEGGGSKEFIFSDIATAEGWVPETDNHYNITLSPINIYVTKGSADYRGRWWSDNTWRIYNGNTVTISSSSGNITSVTSSPSQTFSISAGVATLGASATIKFTSITVNYGTTYYTTDCGSACSTPTLEFDVTEVNKFKGDVPFIKTATLSNNPLGGTITYSSSLPSKAEVNATTGEVTIHEAMSSTPVVITATVNKVTSGVECQKKVTASYTLNIYNRVTWLVNGASYLAGAPTTQTVEGGSIEVYPTDPDGSIVCGGKTFVGWTTAPYAESDTKPTTLYTSLSDMSGVHITDNTIYYAVFAEVTSGGQNKFKRITADAGLVRAAGTKIAIISNNASKILQNDFSVVDAPTPDGDGVITVTDDQIWTLSEKDEYNYWKLTSGSIQLGVEATSGYTSGYYECGNYSTTASYWAIKHANDISGTADCFYLYNWSNGTWYDGLEFFGSTTNKWESVYFATANSNFKNYCAMQIWGPYESYAAYSTTCGPNIKASDPKWLTSTKDQTVKSEAITIKGSNLTGGTLSVKGITGADAAYFSCTLTSSTITAGVIETTYVISYTPTVYGDAQHTATLTFTDGTTDSDPIILHGRSLPENFAIVAHDGANYYALDGTMSGSASTVKPLPVTVTDGAVDICPSQAVYTLTERSTPDENIHLVGPAGRRLYGGSSTGLNMHSASSTEGTGWLLSTSDFNTYHVTNATTTSRGIMYNNTYNVFGHYATGNYGAANYYGNLLLLPITAQCTCLEKPVVTCVAKATRATLTWEPIEGAVNYEISCSGGTYSSSVTETTVTITGLTINTDYTYTVKATASGTDCSLVYNGAFKTTNCDDVPYDIVITPGVKTATFKWKMEAANATIRIYSDEDCTAQVGPDHTGLTSPATITDLTENTTYYAKVWAGGTCVSTVEEFLTNSTSVEVAEWFTDGIRINIDADADASVVIEDKKEHGSESGNVADKLFISKYFEADGNNKMIAIYNGTPDPIDITNMWLKHSNKGASETKICLKKFGKTPGVIAPNEEIIIMRFTSDIDAAISCAEKEDNFDEWNIIPSTPEEQQLDGEGNNIYTWLQFSGPQSIGLYDGSTSKFIDIIGASTDASGSGSLVQIRASNKESCSYTENSNNDGSGFFANGKEVETDNDIVLSTNRCLLIRKNTVKSGDDAIANNVYTEQEACDEYIGHSFSTLGTEWMGFIIGKGAGAADKTCEGLAYVGGFDYQGYYTTYDSIAGLKELSGHQNEDGTYTIPIPQLDTLSCTMMRIKVYEGTTEKASREYKVPIMIDAAATTKDDKYFHSYARETNSADVCRECDVVILGSGTLTKASSDEATDIPEIHNLTIYPGGTLIIPDGAKYEYTVNSIQFRVQGERSPVAKLKGNLITNDGQVLVSRRINNSRYYFFSLPYDCNIDEVRWSNGTPATNGVDYRIAEYDSETRAAEGSMKGAPGHYKQVTGNTLKAGVGYVIATNDRYLKELVFPMDIGSTNLTTAENTKTTNKVALHQYTGSSSINNHNWNLIAHPYVSAFNAYEDAKITAGWLKCTTPATPEDPDGGEWEYVDAGNVYLTMPSFNTDKTTYTQTLSSTVGTINPFLAVFVQAAGEGDMTFDPGNRILSAPARHLAAQAETEDESIFVGVTLSGNGQSDQTNLRIRPDFTDEYQLGYDLLKFTTYYTERPQIYMKTPSYQLAFQAVNDSVAKNNFLPMGVYCEYAGTYTFALDEHYPIDEVEAVYLYDKTTGTTTNLLYDTYTITTSGRINTTSRFSLNVWLNRKAPQITTGIDGVEAPDGITRKILINDHVYIQRGGAIYDVTGKEVFNF